MAFVVHRSTDYRRMRWKNGLGETAEVAISPDGAALESFDWRISMARVESDGPFSPFAGIDRTLSILAGEGLRLVAAGQQPVVLGPVSEPYSFAGDVACEATLERGAVTDLNVMTRRGRCWHRVSRLAGGSYVAAGDLDQAYLVASGLGPVGVRIDGADVLLSMLDSVSLGRGPWVVSVPDVAPAALLLVELGSATR